VVFFALLFLEQSFFMGVIHAGGAIEVITLAIFLHVFLVKFQVFVGFLLYVDGSNADLFVAFVFIGWSIVRNFVCIISGSNYFGGGRFFVFRQPKCFAF
jgi:hypothetical protein